MAASLDFRRFGFDEECWMAQELQSIISDIHLTHTPEEELQVWDCVAQVIKGFPGLWSVLELTDLLTSFYHAQQWLCRLARAPTPPEPVPQKKRSRGWKPQARGHYPAAVPPPSVEPCPEAGCIGYAAFTPPEGPSVEELAEHQWVVSAEMELLVEYKPWLLPELLPQLERAPPALTEPEIMGSFPLLRGSAHHIRRSPQPPGKTSSGLMAATTKPLHRTTGSAQADATLPGTRFHLDLWLSLTLQNWILDMGRPVVMLIWFPLGHPGVAEYLHFLYNVTTPFLLLKMLERSPRMLPLLTVRLGIIAVAMGTTLRLVADSVTQRLLLVGYQLHLSVRENELMKNLNPSSLVDAFELLFFYKDTLGHVMCYIPLFLVLVLFFSGCFSPDGQQDGMTPAACLLLIPNAAYYWYLITEGQTFILFIFTYFTMMATVMHQRRRGLVLNSNGHFMIYSFSAALGLVAIWVVCLWNNDVLRKKLPGLIYVPQPCAVYTLYFHHNTHV
ncbi:ceroid-lipofuscinosis neuronal protein 6 homolog [Pholidichthys leucotaenia]